MDYAVGEAGLPALDGAVCNLQGIPAAVRLDSAAYLVRLGMPAHLSADRDRLLDALRHRGLTEVDPESADATAVGERLTGLQFARWALWGDDAGRTGRVLGEWLHSGAASGPNASTGGVPAVLAEPVGPATAPEALPDTVTVLPPASASALARTSRTGRRRLPHRTIVVALVLAAGTAAGTVTYRSVSAAAPRPVVKAGAGGGAHARGPGSRAVTSSDGSRLQVPASWQASRPAGAGGQMLAVSPDGHASVLLRSVTLAHPIDPANRRAVNDVVDTVLNRSSIRMLSTRRVTVGRLPGYLYAYSFTDPSTGQVGVHWHYFLFDQRRLDTLVLQVLPASRAGDYATSLAAIAASFRPGQ